MSALENVMVGASPRLRMGLPSSLLSAPEIRRETREIRHRAAALMAEVGLSEFIGHAADALPYGALKRLELAGACRKPGDFDARRAGRRAQPARNG